MAKLKLFIFGLDRAGKSVITNFLKTGSINEDTRPTVAFNVGFVEMENLKFEVYDTPGQKRFRSFWLREVNKSDVLIFVLDVSDPLRFEESKEEFKRLIVDLKKREVPLLFLFHKMDVDGSKENIGKAKEIFNLDSLYIFKLETMETTIKDLISMKKMRLRVAQIINEKMMKS